jgi:hypothetical protein
MVVVVVVVVVGVVVLVVVGVVVVVVVILEVVSLINRVGMLVVEEVDVFCEVLGVFQSLRF